MRRKTYRWFLLAILILIVSYYLSDNWYRIMLIQGDSMAPAYHNMQLVILDRHDKDFSYGDVIAFECDNLSSVLVKRVVACPGDTVVISEGTLYVNKEVSIVYSRKGTFQYAGLLEKAIQLSSGQYIAIGDNASSSKDSRFEAVGIVESKSIIGKILT